ncbi:MAG: hypothetical protein H6732_07815 [Alphaproteobacteria bacterium]|nr:hypothetical protein [Alphaproteobacteria bacterium]
MSPAETAGPSVSSGPSWGALARQALRSPALLRADEGREVATSARLLLLGMAGAAAFGTVAGSLHGDVQALYAAVKLPLVVVVPLLASLPTLHWLLGAAGDPRPWQALTREAALAVARIGLLLVAFVPVVWVTWGVGPSHAVAVRVLAAVVAAAFVLGMRELFLVASAREGGVVGRGLAVVLLALTLGQASWALRPFVGAPGDERVFLVGADGLFVRGLVDPMYRDGGR